MKTFILDGIWGWHSRWEILRRRMENAFGHCEIWVYDNSGKTSLEVSGRDLAEIIRNAGEPVSLVGYSMGGLVIREAIRNAPEATVQGAAFLHSPHAGSLAATMFRLPACREMRPGSRFLERLNNAPWTVPTLATWCIWDAVVIPGLSARWQRAAKIIHSPVPAHAWPVISPGLHTQIVRFLEDPGTR